MESTAEDMARRTFLFCSVFGRSDDRSASTSGCSRVCRKAFFPATLATDDPFVADELSLPTVVTGRTPATEDEPSTRETEVSAEFSKRITQDFGISVAAEYRQLKPDGMPDESGFGNLELGFNYQVYTSAPHETIVSVGLGWEAGGSGRKAVDADSFSTLTPTLFFGKGFGDLPSSLDLLKPLALTGTIGVAIPTRTSTATTTVDPTSGKVDTGVTLNPSASSRSVAAEALARYSILGIACVGSLVATGAVNTRVLVGSTSALFGTPYGQLLLLKLGLFSAMVAIAAINRQRLRPRLCAAIRIGSVREQSTALVWLGRNVIAELCIGISVLFVAGALGVTAPGVHTHH